MKTIKRAVTLGFLFALAPMTGTGASDTTPPEILCPRLIQTQCESTAGAAVRFTVTASDASDTNVLVQCNPPSGAIFPPGTNIVTCTATDDAGNVARCTFPIVIRGDCTPAPCVSIVCPSNIIVKCSMPGGAVVNFMARATNVCDRELTVTCDPPSGSLFPAGLTTVLCTAQGRTNAVFCSFLVEVQDDTPPTINCPTNIIVAAQGVDGAVVQWTATATDDCDTNVTVYCDPPPGSLFALGATIVRCAAIDDSGNESVCAFRVTVREERPLTIRHQSHSNAVIQWYVPGAVEVATTLFPPDWRPATGSIITNRDERTLLYPLSGLIHFFRLVAAPLAPPRDEDDDGVPDALDRCPGTPAGAVVDTHGCSLMQLATLPEQIVGRGLEMLDEVRGHWREYPRLNIAEAQIAERVAEMNMALGFVRDGRITDPQEPLGLERFSQAVEGLRDVHNDLLGIIAGLERDILANPPVTHGYADTTPQAAELIALRIQASRFQRALVETESAEDALLELRRSRIGQSTLHGKIAEINDAQRWIKLTDGKRIGLAERQFDGLLTVGAEVDLEVQTFTDGSALAHSVEMFKTGVTFILPEIRCLFLRIAPVQQLPPYFPTTPVLHYPTAYEHDGTLFLEQGMRLAAASGNCPATLVPPGTFVTTRMKLELHYKPEGIDSSYKMVTLATSLGSDSEPVPLPWDISTSGAELTVTVFRQQCPSQGLPGSCSDPEALSVDSYALHVRPRYNYAAAEYQTTVFNLEDSPQEEGYRVTQVTNVSVTVTPPLSGPAFTFTFKALGFTVAGDELDFDFLSLNEPFAVHEWDFYDTPGIFFKEQTFGVTNRSALYWPRISGHHHGRPFRYTCGLPQLTRDAVFFCGSLPHTFYRLPFTGGWPTWSLSQGNFGSFSHTNSQSYALDFGAPAGTQIRAARGGIVEAVEESYSANGYDSTQGICTNFNANYLAIRHQDGSMGNYAHIAQNGVQVLVGQKVRRGDAIAIVGNTGCSSGPHLHFYASDFAGNNSILARFERWNTCIVPLPPVPCLPLLECIVPATGEILFSTQ